MDVGPDIFNSVNLQQILQTIQTIQTIQPKAIVCDNIYAAKQAYVSVGRHRLGYVVASCSVGLALLRLQSLDPRIGGDAIRD